MAYAIDRSTLIVLISPRWSNDVSIFGSDKQSSLNSVYGQSSNAQRPFS